MRPIRLWPLVTLALAGCDDREAIRHMHPSLERMLTQPRSDPYGASTFFADGRAMREPPPDTVARGAERVESGRADGRYLDAVPLPLTRALLETGRRRFETYCAACHGVAGDGRSVVAEKMERRRPESLHSERVRALPAGRVFEITGDGYGFMPGYADALSPDERWAIVAYLDALRLSRAAPVASLPPPVQAELRREAP